VNNKIWNAIHITFIVILLNIHNFQVATKTQRIDLPAIALAQARQAGMSFNLPA
jgi:hypothetical protein